MKYEDSLNEFELEQDLAGLKRQFNDVLDFAYRKGYKNGFNAGISYIESTNDISIDGLIAYLNKIKEKQNGN